MHILYAAVDFSTELCTRGYLLGGNCRIGICKKKYLWSVVTGLKLSPVNSNFHCLTAKYFSEVCFIAKSPASFSGRRAARLSF